MSNSDCFGPRRGPRALAQRPDVIIFPFPVAPFETVLAAAVAGKWIIVFHVCALCQLFRVFVSGQLRPLRALANRRVLPNSLRFVCLQLLARTQITLLLTKRVFFVPV